MGGGWRSQSSLGYNLSNSNLVNYKLINSSTLVSFRRKQMFRTALQSSGQ